jgi:hypothetical protein
MTAKKAMAASAMPPRLATEMRSATLAGRATAMTMWSPEAPRGPDASSRKALVNGYDDIYATYNLEASGPISFAFEPSENNPVERPIFVIHEYQGKAPTLTLDRAAATVNAGDANSTFFASVDAEKRELWLTLNRRVDAEVTVSVTP